MPSIRHVVSRRAIQSTAFQFLNRSFAEASTLPGTDTVSPSTVKSETVTGLQPAAFGVPTVAVLNVRPQFWHCRVSSPMYSNHA